MRYRIKKTNAILSNSKEEYCCFIVQYEKVKRFFLFEQCEWEDLEFFKKYEEAKEFISKKINFKECIEEIIFEEK